MKYNNMSTNTPEQQKYFSHKYALQKVYKKIEERRKLLWITL